MATYRVQGPDGRIHKFEGPDDASPQEVEAFAAQTFGSMQREAVSKAEPSRLTSFARGARDTAAGAIRGAGSIGATILAPFDVAKDALAGKGLSLESNRQRRADMDAALADLTGADPESLAFGGGKLFTEIAGTLGVGNAIARAPGLAAKAPQIAEAIRTGGMTAGGAGIGTRIGGGAVTGAASAGLVNPDDAGTGAVVGGALPAIIKVAGAAGNAAGGWLRPNINNPELAAKAVQQYGIPLGAADISADRGTKALRSVLNDAPFVGGIGTRQGEAVQRGFNKAVGRTFGADADSLTPEVLDAAKKRMGAEFDRIWNGNTLTVDMDMAAQLAELRKEVDKLPQGDAARLSSWLEDFATKVVDDGQGNFVMPGEVANRLQSRLRQDADKAQGFLKEALTRLRGTVLEAFNRGVSPEDAAALSMNRGQYKAFKTVEPMLQGAEAGVAGRTVGDIPPAMLPQAVRQSYRGGIAGSPFADLSQIGSQYIVDRVARTGGGPRAMIQNSALGGGLALGAYAEPATLAALPIAAGLQGVMGSPRVAQAMLKANAGAVPRVSRSVQQLLDDPLLQALYYRVPAVAAADR